MVVKNFSCSKSHDSDSSQFIFEINVGNKRIRNTYRTLWIWMASIDFESTILYLEIHHSISESFYVESDSFRHWFQKYNDFGLNFP